MTSTALIVSAGEPPDPAGVTASVRGSLSSSV
jgi:hypothetical protein